MGNAEHPQPTGSGVLDQWDAYAERLRAQLPAAPEGLLNGYVLWAPWIAIVFGVVGLLGLLTLLQATAALSPLFMYLPGAQVVGGQIFLNLLLGLALSAAEVLGGYLMYRMRLMGWWVMALGLAISLLNSLFHLSALGLVLTPGPNMMYLVSRSICQVAWPGWSRSGASRSASSSIWCARRWVSPRS